MVLHTDKLNGFRIADIPYTGSALASSTLYYWRIKFWDQGGLDSAYSTSSSFYLAPQTGTAQYVQVVQNTTFTYDAVGNITAIQDQNDTGTGKSVSYTYDTLHRLTTASTTAASTTPYSLAYTYDILGNITTGDQGAYTYNQPGWSNPHAATTIGGIPQYYDKNGNLASTTLASYAWDYRNRLVRASNTATTTFGYDHTQERTFKATGTATTTYASKLYNLDSRTPTKHVFTPQGDLIATIYGTSTTATTTFPHSDHLGGTSIVTDVNGDLRELSDYYPYGTSRVSLNYTGTPEQRKYAGTERDTETSLDYMNARYYEGSRGQFLSQDPMFWKLPKQLLADPQQQNSYSYGRDNPITMKDPTGESSIYSWFTDPYSSMFYTGSLGSVATAAQFSGRPATAMLLAHSLSLNPGPLYAGNDSVLTQAITSNSLYQSGLQKMLNDASARGETSISNAQLPLNFKQGDASTSFGKIDIYINATRGKDGSWQVAGQGQDVYNFQYMPYQNKVFSTVNNTAYFGQNQGTVSNFTTYVNFSQTISPSQTFTTPSGAVVRWDGSLVSGPPQKK